MCVCVCVKKMIFKSPPVFFPSARTVTASARIAQRVDRRKRKELLFVRQRSSIIQLNGNIVALEKKKEILTRSNIHIGDWNRQ